MFTLWCRWRYGREHPFAVYHGDPAAVSPFPERVDALIGAFALFAHEQTMKAAAPRL